ncbi:MAG: ribosomal-processing cysteine protease Prp [Clostridia bacterium]|nr:ribosomal-processing cysteine protease Prp [Clostridia bacterium]
MVKVVFYKSGGNYYGFRESGHSGYDDAGKDIVCAAVSAMTMLVINTIEVAYACDVDYTIDDETTDVTVIAKSALSEFQKDKAKQFAVSGLIYSYFLQLNDMLEDYYDYIDVSEEERPI